MVVRNDSIISLKALIDSRPAEYLLDSGTTHSLLALSWWKNRGLESEYGD